MPPTTPLKAGASPTAAPALHIVPPMTSRPKLRTFILAAAALAGCPFSALAARNGRSSDATRQILAIACEARGDADRSRLRLQGRRYRVSDPFAISARYFDARVDRWALHTFVFTSALRGPCRGGGSGSCFYLNAIDSNAELALLVTTRADGQRAKLQIADLYRRDRAKSRAFNELVCRVETDR